MVDASRDADNPNKTRQRLLDAAIKLFADRGFEACTMRELGQAVGIKAPAIYNHYESKEQLLSAATWNVLRRFFTAVVGPLIDDAEDERLKALVLRWVAFQVGEVEISKANDALIDAGALKRLLPPRDWEKIAASLRYFVDLVSSLIGDVAKTDQRVVVNSVIAVCDRAWRTMERDQGLSADEIAAEVWAVCLRIVAVE